MGQRIGIRGRWINELLAGEQPGEVAPLAMGAQDPCLNGGSESRASRRESPAPVCGWDPGRWLVLNLAVLVLVADDVHLVRSAQAGDVWAFEELVRRHELPVYRLALRMLGNTSDAEDASQETFIRAWRALASFRAESALSTWLYRIATNQCLRVLDRSGVRTGPLTGEELDLRPGPETVALERDALHNLKVAIARLTPEQRAPLVLREFEGLAYEEIGEVLDLTPGAVKGRLHRARLELLKGAT